MAHLTVFCTVCQMLHASVVVPNHPADVMPCESLQNFSLPNWEWKVHVYSKFIPEW